MEHTVEDLYKLLQNSEWDQLLELESKHRNSIVSDLMMKQIFDTYFIDAIVDYVEKIEDNLYASLVLSKVYSRFLHHRHKTYSIPDEKFEKLVYKYLHYLELVGEVSKAYKIAKSWQQIEYAQQFVSEYESTHPKELEHSNDDTIKVSENPNIQETNHTIPLFKSKQESEFFYAVRENYLNFFTYPNVAVSCIIDYDAIKNDLTADEKDYFFFRSHDFVGVYRRTCIQK